jgi:hypothetical protein
MMWVSLCGQSESPAVRGFTLPAKTSVPFTYCIWYRPDPENESFLGDVKASPPDLFHLGYQIPFKGALGPTYGHELFTDNILPPGDIPHEVERIKTILQKMRGAGVRRLIPYVYTMAFFGNPDRRTGFFHFFDHWDDYASYGLGPKPPGDPTLWLQAEGPNPLGGGPPDVLHYHACINHPAWSAYLDLVVRQIGAVGYDGMFFDVNTQHCYCPYCEEKFHLYLFEKYGREGLREAFGAADTRQLNLARIGGDVQRFVLQEFKPYMAGIWKREDLRQVVGAEDADKVSLQEGARLLHCYMGDSMAEFPPPEDLKGYLVGRFGGEHVEGVADNQKEEFVQTVLRCHFREFLESQDLAASLRDRFGSSDLRRGCAAPRDLLLWVETQRFWSDSMASMFARLKNEGRKVFAEQGRKEDFYTVANLGPVAHTDGMYKRRADGIDLVRWARSADMQMFEEMQQCGTLANGTIISNIFALRFAMGAGTTGGTLLYMAGDDRGADLAEAEIAAGGGGAFIQAALGAPDSRRRWQKFFSDHADLWKDGVSCAQVGLLFWNDQLYYQFPEHLSMTRRLVNVLSETQVPFDIVTEENLGGIGHYRVVIAPSLRYLDNAQIETLLAYAGNGGNLVVVEPFGTEDKWARPRTKAFGSDTQAPEFSCVARGTGQVLWIKPQAVPTRRSDFWNLLEDRANNFVQARDYLDAARRSDTENRVDLGPAFIQRIEESLQLRLRWCPRNTDPAFYVHAYRLPAQSGHPERLVVHAVNYHLPISVKENAEKPAGAGADWSPPTKSDEPVDLRGINLTVPKPDGMNVKTVESLRAYP